MHETKARRILGVSIFVLAGIVWALGAGSAMIIANQGGAHVACARSGPWQVEGSITDAAPVDASFSWWPVGRECEWPTTDGSTALVVQDESWTATYTLLALGAISLSGIVVTLLPARKLDDVLTG
jgi:hypothetical protein